jgi:hypothetical protein
MSKEIALQLSNNQATIITLLISMIVISFGMIILAFQAKNISQAWRYIVGAGAFFCTMATTYAVLQVYFISQKVGIFK